MKFGGEMFINALKSSDLQLQVIIKLFEFYYILKFQFKKNNMQIFVIIERGSRKRIVVHNRFGRNFWNKRMEGQFERTLSILAKHNAKSY